MSLHRRTTQGSAFCILLSVLVGCEPSVETVQRTTDQAKLARIAVNARHHYGKESAGKAAVTNLTDQALLGKVALEARVNYVRRAAVKKLTDQALLVKIAVGDADEEVRGAAIQTIKDPAMLAKLAVEDRRLRVDVFRNLQDQATLAKLVVDAKDVDVRTAAMWHLRDRTLLASIAMEDGNEAVRSAAVKQLGDSGAFAKLDMTQADPDLKLCARIYYACQALPKQHRDRLIGAFSTIVYQVRDPLVTTELGDIAYVTNNWTSYGETYGDVRVDGEAASLSVKLSKLDRVFTWKWSTRFSREILVTKNGTRLASGEIVWKTLDPLVNWQSADFAPDACQKEICECLSEPTLNRLASESARMGLRSAALSRLHDLALLPKIALEDKDANVRRAAAKGRNSQ